MTRDSRRPPGSGGAALGLLLVYENPAIRTPNLLHERHQLPQQRDRGRRSTTIEHNLVDAGGLGPLGDELTEPSRSGNRAAAAGGALARFVARRRGDRAAALVVDHLQDEVLVRTEHSQARTSRGALDLLADAPVATDAGLAANFGVITHGRCLVFSV